VSERVSVLVVNFGEPDEPVPEKVQPFLERIFLQNAGLEPDEEQVARARQLARDRTPGLIEEYRAIGGSPLNRQAEAQAEALGRVLRDRGHDVRVHAVYQYTEPTVAEGVAAARAAGAEALVVLPVYPLCGASTTVAAIADARRALEETGWAPRFRALAGWHQREAYVRLRTDGIERFLEEHGLDLDDPDTLLYFSVHGTPIRYLEEGNRYDRYVQEQCRDIARRLGAVRHGIGFQNHTNRRIAWTQPDNEDRIEAARERRLVVVPISFMHEQSETLAELDQELRAFAEERGKEFHRVPVPHEDPRFVDALAELVEDVLGAPERPTGTPVSGLTPCRCAPWPGVWCTNGDRDLPPSPFTGPRRTADA